MTKNEERINKLFKELVPETGKADSLAGELVRAMSRIGYRFYNDGDQLGSARHSRQPLRKGCPEPFRRLPRCRLPRHLQSALRFCRCP